MIVDTARIILERWTAADTKACVLYLWILRDLGRVLTDFLFNIYMNLYVKSTDCFLLATILKMRWTTNDTFCWLHLVHEYYFVFLDKASENTDWCHYSFCERKILDIYLLEIGNLLIIGKILEIFTTLVVNFVLQRKAETLFSKENNY